MDIEKIKEIISKQSLNLYLKFDFEFKDNGVFPDGPCYMNFSSNIINNRFITFTLTEVRLKEGLAYYFILNVVKTDNVKYEDDEDPKFLLELWLRRNMNYNRDKFLIFPEKGNMEEQFSTFFKYVESLFEIEELNKIIKGEYWEYKTKDWSSFGR